MIGGSQGANVFDKVLKDKLVNISKDFPIKLPNKQVKKIFQI